MVFKSEEDMPLRSLIFLLFHNSILCVDLCGNTKNMSGSVGGETILQVSTENTIKDIIWNIGDNVIATTVPDKPIDVRYDPLENRLLSMRDASLQITYLKETDQGTYTASIRYMTKKACKQRYQLTLYKKLSEADIIIHHNVTRNETCDVMLTCTVNATDVSLIWKDYNGNSVKKDVLHIQNVMENLNYSCTAVNPISKASRSVFLGKYCKEEKYLQDSRASQLHLGLYAALPFLIIIMVLIVYFAIMRKRKKKETDIVTVYAQVQRPNQRRTMNEYKVDQGGTENTNTVYSVIRDHQEMISN
ncbi:SLAM family member 9-like isoform 1-T1 [Discoglossus pictus]